MGNLLIRSVFRLDNDRRPEGTADMVAAGLFDEPSLSAHFVLPGGDPAHFRLEVYTSFDAARPLWLAFESAGGAGYPFQSISWLSAWQRHIGARRGIRPRIVMVRDGDGRVVMLLPLGLGRVRLVWRLAPLGDPVCDYCSPLIDPDFAEALDARAASDLWAAILALIPGLDYAILTHQPPRIEAATNPFYRIALRTFSAGAHATSLGDNWEAFHQARIKGKHRAKARSRWRGLNELGEARCERVLEPEARRSLMRDIVRRKEAQLREQKALSNPFARPGISEFYDAVAADEHIEVFRLTVAGEFVAGAICLRREPVLYYIVPVYDAARFGRYSPGALLFQFIMQWCIENGLARFDFTIGDEPYKAEWTDEDWELRWDVWPATVRGQIAASVEAGFIETKRWIKQRRELVKLLERISGIMRG